MTPAEKKELVSELSSVLATVIDRKLEPIVVRLGKLEGADRQHERGVRDARVEVVRSEHDIKAETNDVVLAAVRHCTGAMQAMTTEFKAIKEAQARIETNSNRSLVALPDGQGGTSVRPASMVAAESSVRTENKQDSIGRVVLDAALDTTKAKDNSAAAKRRGTATLIVTVVVALWHIYVQIAHAHQ